MNLLKKLAGVMALGAGIVFIAVGVLPETSNWYRFVGGMLIGFSYTLVWIEIDKLRRR